MPTPLIPTAYRVTAVGSLFGQLVENVWYAQGPDPFDAGAAALIAAEFQTGYTLIMDNLSQDYSVSQFDVQNLAGVASGSYTLSVAGGIPGTIAQDSMPGSVAFCVRLRSALAGKRTRGRKYFAGLGEADVTGNSLLGARADGIVSAITTLIDNLIVAGFPMQIVSFAGATSVPVVSASYFDLFVDSQRRRLTGRGR